MLTVSTWLSEYHSINDDLRYNVKKVCKVLRLFELSLIVRAMNCRSSSEVSIESSSIINTHPVSESRIDPPFMFGVILAVYPNTGGVILRYV
jgi:hypothetical protein